MTTACPTNPRYGVMLAWETSPGQWQHSETELTLDGYTRRMAWSRASQLFGESLSAMREIEPTPSAWLPEHLFTSKKGA